MARNYKAKRGIPMNGRKRDLALRERLRMRSEVVLALVRSGMGEREAIDMIARAMVAKGGDGVLTGKTLKHAKERLTEAMNEVKAERHAPRLASAVPDP